MRVPAEYISSRQESRIRELASRITATSGPTARATSSTSVTGMTYGVQEEASAPYPTGAQEPQLPPRDPDQLPHPPPPPLPEVLQREGGDPILHYDSTRKLRLTSPDQFTGHLQGWSLKFELKGTWCVDPTSAYQIAQWCTSERTVGLLPHRSKEA